MFALMTWSCLYRIREWFWLTQTDLHQSWLLWVSNFCLEPFSTVTFVSWVGFQSQISFHSIFDSQTDLQRSIVNYQSTFLLTGVRTINSTTHTHTHPRSVVQKKQIFHIISDKKKYILKKVKISRYGSNVWLQSIYGRVYTLYNLFTQTKKRLSDFAIWRLLYIICRQLSWLIFV